MRRSLCPFLLLSLLFAGCADALPWSAYEQPLIEPGKGVGPIRFGMKKEEVFRRLGAVRSTSASSYGQGNGRHSVDADGYSYSAKHLHMYIFTFPDAGVQELSVANYHHHLYLPWHPSPRTSRGITLGSTREQVLAAYGTPTNTHSHWADDSLEYSTLGMRFQFDRSGRVDYIYLVRPEFGLRDLPSALLSHYQGSIDN